MDEGQPTEAEVRVKRVGLAVDPLAESTCYGVGCAENVAAVERFVGEVQSVKKLHKTIDLLVSCKHRS